MRSHILTQVSRFKAEYAKYAKAPTTKFKIKKIGEVSPQFLAMWSRSSGYYVFAVVCFTVVGTLPQAQETRKFGNHSHRGRRPHIVFLLQDDLGV